MKQEHKDEFTRIMWRVRLIELGQVKPGLARLYRRQCRILWDLWLDRSRRPRIPPKLKPPRL